MWVMAISWLGRMLSTVLSPHKVKGLPTHALLHSPSYSTLAPRPPTFPTKPTQVTHTTPSVWRHRTAMRAPRTRRTATARTSASDSSPCCRSSSLVVGGGGGEFVSRPSVAPSLAGMAVAAMLGRVFVGRPSVAPASSSTFIVVFAYTSFLSRPSAPLSFLSPWRAWGGQPHSSPPTTAPKTSCRMCGMAWEGAAAAAAAPSAAGSWAVPSGAC